MGQGYGGAYNTRGIVPGSYVHKARSPSIVHIRMPLTIEALALDCGLLEERYEVRVALFEQRKLGVLVLLVRL